MNIIGISGIEGTIAFKRSVWPDLDERDYRISQGHDSAAALIVNGSPVAAAAEERFTRQKHTGAFPKEAISFCLSQANLKLSDIDEVVHGFDYDPYQNAFQIDSDSRRLYRDVYSRDALLALIRRDSPRFPTDRVRWVPHHLAHAASAYYTSGWDNCLVVVMDGMGEVHGASIFFGQGGRLKRLAAMYAHDSIGILYSLVTLHLGFEFNSDEYKIMGLAPYGDPTRFRQVFENLVAMDPDGSIHIPLLKANANRRARETYSDSRAQLASMLGDPRHPDSPIHQMHCDIAAALQECLNRVMLHVCGHFGKETGMKRLALAGGVALNCTANGALIRSGLFEDIYIQPAAGDDGTALGAALYRAAMAGEIHNVRFPAPLLGPSYSRDAIRQAVSEFHGRMDVHECPSLDETCKRAASLIAEGKVLAWYRGRMEFGPRALGNRSILADPGIADMRERINAMVKLREAFRPFAPAVTLEQVDRWFDVPPMTRHPYMITTVNVHPQLRAELPAITHVDGSARVQTVSQDDNREFHRLLQAVGGSTGREMLLNTSFNIKGQPIVNTPSDAIKTYLGTGIEILFLDNFVLTRREAATELDRHHLGELIGAQRA